MPLFQNESYENISYENMFDLHENEPVGGLHFYINGFARRLVLAQRQKATRKKTH